MRSGFGPAISGRLPGGIGADGCRGAIAGTRRNIYDSETDMVHIDTCDDVTIDAAVALAATWPFARDCEHHTPCPEGYNHWHAWADLMHRNGYSQITCDRCSRFSIWLPKKIASSIRADDNRKAKAFLKLLQLDGLNER